MQRIYFYNHTCYHLGGNNYSLNDIEHGLLRGNSKPHNSYARMFTPQDPRLRCSVLVWDPRIHFALVRGTKSCPVLRVRIVSRSSLVTAAPEMVELLLPPWPVHPRLRFGFLVGVCFATP